MASYVNMSGVWYSAKSFYATTPLHSVIFKACYSAVRLVHTGRGRLCMHGRRGGNEAREEKGAERVIRVEGGTLSRQVLTTSCYAVVDLQVQRLGLLLGSVLKEE